MFNAVIILWYYFVKKAKLSW